jgi:hypothetical protein
VGQQNPIKQGLRESPLSQFGKEGILLVKGYLCGDHSAEAFASVDMPP